MLIFFRLIGRGVRYLKISQVGVEDKKLRKWFKMLNVNLERYDHCNWWKMVFICGGKRHFYFIVFCGNLLKVNKVISFFEENIRTHLLYYTFYRVQFVHRKLTFP